MGNQAGRVFPNLWILLTGPPAVGKSIAIDPIKKLWKKTKGKVKVASNSVTRASILDEMNAAKEATLIPGLTNGGGALYEHNSLSIGASELGVLVGEYDQPFLNLLTELYDCKDDFSATTRTSKSVYLTHVYLNLIAGVQPAYLSYLLPDVAWGQGFMARMIMVYSATCPHVDLWGEEEEFEKPKLIASLEQRIKNFLNLYGKVTTQPEAIEFFREWERKNFAPAPMHSKLGHYSSRRKYYIRKLCIISAASRGDAMTITLKDMEWAKDALLEAERTMPDAFRDMSGKSDAAVMRELHQACWQEYAKYQKPIHKSFLWNILHRRCPSDKIPRIIVAVDQMGMITKIAEDLYIPRPEDKWSVE